MTKLYYPQLSTGNLAQFPSKKHVHQRTVLNRLPNDGTIKFAVPEAAQYRWELVYNGLTDGEASKLHGLFDACEGRLREFVFVDPFSNLLRWTEALSKSVWQTSLGVADQIEAPDGTATAIRLTNAAQSGHAIAQSVDAPGWYRYAFGVWARSDSTDRLSLRIDNADGSVSITRPISSTWEHISIASEIPGESEEIRCAIELPPACAVDVYGPQLDAQADTFGYRKNNDKSGVYAARFDQDEFECISLGPDNHSTRIRVVTLREITT